MASGSFTGTTSNTYITPRISWSSTANTSTNKSSLTVRFQLRKSSKSTESTYGTGSWKLTIGDNVYSFSDVITIKTNDTYMTVYSKTVTVSHNDDGGKSILIKVTGGMSGTTYTSTSLSKTIDLDTIPRSSTFSVPSSVNTGSSLTISITPSSSTFRHKFMFAIDGKTKYTSGYVAAGTKSFSYTIPHPWLPNVTSAKITVYCYTYPASGDSYIGRVTKTVMATVPANIKPVVSEVAKTLVNGLDGKYVQGKSQIKLAATATPGNGSAISSYIFKGANISGTATSYTGSSNTKTSSIIQATGALTYQIAAKDTRGRVSDYKAVSISVYEYAAPQITSVSAQRCLKDGTINTDGTYAKVTVKVSHSTVGGSNTRSVTLSSSVDNYAAATTVISTSATNNTYTGVYGGGKFDLDTTYQIKAIIKDKYTSHEKSVSLKVAQRTINIAKYGNGVAIGGLSTVTSKSAAGKFECNWNTDIKAKLSVAGNITTNGDIGCSEPYDASSFAMYCQWKDRENHDILVRGADGLTMGLGWIGDDTNTTVLDVRPKKVNIRGATHFQCTNDASTSAQNDVPVRIGNASGTHIDIDGNEIIAKDSPTELGNLNLGGKIIAMYVDDIDTLKTSSDSTSTFVKSVPTYNRTYDGSPNMYITSNGVFGRSTSSSERYKTDIEDVKEDILNPYNILNIPIRQYKYNADNVPIGKDIEDLYIGIIAEEVAKVYPAAAEYNEDGQVEMWNIKVIVPAMLKILQDQQKEIIELKQKVEDLEMNQPL